MSCYHPMTRAEKFGTAYTNKQGKISYEYDFFSWEEYEQAPKVYDTKYRKIQMVPCGKCIGCRLDYSRQWANRIMLECKERPINTCWFVTLTYNPENLPINQIMNQNTGEIITGNTLVKEHLSKFMKDLRRYWEYHYKQSGIKFFGCGEYGGDTNRPHYHIAIMGMHLDPMELKPYKDTENGRLWIWEEGAKIWNKGYVVIGRLEWDSAAYVARYIMKKQKGPTAENYYNSKAIIPEFVNMSRRPGIGRDYYEKHKDEIYQYDKIVLTSGHDVIEAKPPKYYDNLYDIEDETYLNALKVERKRAQKNSELLKDKHTPYSRAERRAIDERTKMAKAKMLRREEF